MRFGSPVCFILALVVYGWSNPALAVDVQPPANLTASDGTSDYEITFSWQNLSTSGLIEIFRNWDCTGEVFVTLYGYQTSWYDRTIKAGQTYAYSSRRFVVDGNNRTYSQCSNTDTGYAKLPTPSLQSVSFDTWGPLISVSWGLRTSENLVGYHLLRRLVAVNNPPFEVVAWINSQSTHINYEDISVPPGVEFEYRVKAVAVNGSFSDESSSGYGRRKYEAPSLKPPSYYDPASVKLDWSPPANSPSNQRYEVFRSTTNTACAYPPIASNLSSTSYSDISVQTGQEYFYSVRASHIYNGIPFTSSCSSALRGRANGYSISGRIAESGPNRVEMIIGDVIRSCDYDPRVDEYYCRQIPPGANVQLRPWGVGSTFQPPIRSYTDVNQDFTNQDFAVVSSSSSSSSASSIAVSSPSSHRRSSSSSSQATSRSSSPGQSSSASSISTNSSAGSSQPPASSSGQSSVQSHATSASSLFSSSGSDSSRAQSSNQSAPGSSSAVSSEAALPPGGDSGPAQICLGDVADRSVLELDKVEQLIQKMINRLASAAASRWIGAGLRHKASAWARSARAAIYRHAQILRRDLSDVPRVLSLCAAPSSCLAGELRSFMELCQSDLDAFASAARNACSRFIRLAAKHGQSRERALASRTARKVRRAIVDFGRAQNDLVNQAVTCGI